MLEAVTDIGTRSNTFGFVEFFWTAPFSLNITKVDPDIAYCVDVYCVTCGGNIIDHVISNCCVLNPSYQFEATNFCSLYKADIVPKSNIPKSKNGTKESFTGT